MSDHATDEPTDTVPLCSAKGCQQAATWAHRWNNPKLHTPERRKVWLACDDHRTSLADFLTARGFLKETVPFDPEDPAANEGLAV